ncbi:unnamed protein product [Effrenium voratum]|nr:unnamed protein product [Effrenium voratum]
MASKPMSSLLAAGAAAVGLALWIRRKAQENAARRAALARRGAEAYGLSSQKLSEMAEDFDRRYIRSGRLRGAVVAVMRGGEVVAVWELGSFTKQTVFKLYSITKVFTAIAGLQVCEEHKISLDTPISTLVPEWPDKLNLEDEKGRLVPVEEPLLLRHCFTHTGGFSDTMRGAHPTCLWRPVERRRWAAAASQKPADLREMMAWEGQEPLLCRPGQHFNYLGVAWPNGKGQDGDVACFWTEQ